MNVLPKNLYKVIDEPLKWPEVYNILSNFNPETDNYTESMNSYFPENGWTYIFYTADPKLVNDYKADRFKWRHNGSGKKQPHGKEPKVIKNYFDAHIGGERGTHKSEFFKYVWKLIDAELPVLIQYIGNLLNI